jgi:hypothetical protein
MLAAGLGMSVLLLSGNSFSADKTMPEMKKKMPEAEMMQDDAAAMPQPCRSHAAAMRQESGGMAESMKPVTPESDGTSMPESMMDEMVEPTKPSMINPAENDMEKATKDSMEKPMTAPGSEGMQSGGAMM